MNQEIVVSIICNAYNHEKYIKDALESFVKQKTTFKYEILIHDDASTDKTVEIIRVYENEYPDLIKPIYQTENQYSKGCNINSTFQYPRAKGKYIALCEGDDYWIDENKLQKQVEIMEKNPEVDMCAHAAKIINSANGKEMGKISSSKRDCIFSTKEVITGGGGFVATNSLLYRASLNCDIPEFRKFFPLDYTLQIHGSLRGGIIFIKDEMSVYRFMVPGSWSQRQVSNQDARKKFVDKVNKMFDLLDFETNYKYINTIVKMRCFYICEYYKGIYKEKELLTSDYKELLKYIPFKQRLKIKLKTRFPRLIKFLKGK